MTYIAKLPHPGFQIPYLRTSRIWSRNETHYISALWPKLWARSTYKYFSRCVLHFLPSITTSITKSKSYTIQSHELVSFFSQKRTQALMGCVMFFSEKIHQTRNGGLSLLFLNLKINSTLAMSQPELLSRFQKHRWDGTWWLWFSNDTYISIVGGRGAPNGKYLRSIFTPPLPAKLSACRVYKTYRVRLVSFFYTRIILHDFKESASYRMDAPPPRSSRNEHGWQSCAASSSQKSICYNGCDVSSFLFSKTNISGTWMLSCLLWI